MVKRSKLAIFNSILASILTFATYFLLVTVCGSAEVQDLLNGLGDQSHWLKATAEGIINSICTTFLVLAIATFVLGILASFFKVANVLLNIIAWFYLFYGIIVICLLQFLFCRSAAARNRKYFKKRALMNSGELAAAKMSHEDDVIEDAPGAVGDVAEGAEGEADGEAAAPAKKAAKKNKRNVFNTNWSVILKSADGENKKVVKKIRKFTGFNKKEVAAFLEKLPEFVVLNASKKEAKKAYKKLKKLGCEVEML